MKVEQGRKDLSCFERMRGLSFVARLARAFSALVICFSVMGCQFEPPKPPLTQLQLRQLQSRSYENRDMIVAMRAVINALLDEGFIIKNADKDLGFVQATKDIEIAGAGAFAEFGGFFGNNQTRWRNSTQIDCSGTLTAVGKTTNVRLIFQRKTLDNFGVPMGIALIEDPAYYQNVFTKIDKSLFLEREGLAGQ
jgi:hypothetical protein